MSVITIDTRDRKPIYEQICDNIKKLTLRGVFRPGEQLPGVRSLAMELAINPNTIVKAYTELERAGIIYTLPGRGSFVCDNLDELVRQQRESALAELTATLTAAHGAGIDKNAALNLLNSIWRDSND